MSKNNSIPFFQKVMTEVNQGHETRKKLFAEIESELTLPVISYFTSFNYPVMIEDSDADILEGLLQKMDLTNGLALLINSPGGIGIAAERIINICRHYSGTKEFVALVPGKAKSAATMVCFGASKIYMGGTSELGPIDPQMTLQKDNKVMRFALCNIVDSYKDLFKRATEEKGNLQPYLQQLANYDSREIKEFEAAIELAKDVAVRALENGMMKKIGDKNAIEHKIKVFLTPEHTKTHSRAIYHTEAISCGLNIELIDPKSTFWKNLYELYIRTDHYVSTRASKCFETRSSSFAASPK